MTSSVTTPDGVQTTTTSTFRGKPAYVQVGTQAGATPLPAEANTYDTSDNLTQSTSPNGVVTSHTYDDYNDLASTTTASGPTSPTSLTGASETTNETWNVLGELKTSFDASSLATNYTYDGLGDPLTVVAPGASSGTTSTFSFSYDAAGQRVEAQEPGGPSGTITRDWAYNTLGQLASAFEYPTTSTTLQTTYAYGADGELTSSTPQGGPNLCHTYDDYLAQTSRYSVPLAQSCATGTQSNLETFTTSPISGPTGAVEGTSGPSVSIVYDSTDPLRVDHVTEGTTKTQYAYSPTTGQVQSAAETIGSQTNTTSYAYNSTTGLVSGVTDPFTSLQTTYQYNPDGQLSQQTLADGRVTAYTYDSAGRLVQANTTEAGQSPLTFGVSYNLLGEVANLSQAYPAVGGNVNNSGGWVYSYTPAGELGTTQFTPTGGSAGPLTTYGYDGSGNRTSTTVGSTTTNDSYDGAGRLA
ncbi:MAG TPA: hypothetical protein VGL44_13365, partial [Gaiellales bacterium]